MESNPIIGSTVWYCDGVFCPIVSGTVIAVFENDYVKAQAVVSDHTEAYKMLPVYELHATEADALERQAELIDDYVRMVENTANEAKRKAAQYRRKAAKLKKQAKP